MKSDYQNSISIVYNNLIIPENQNQRIKNEIIESVDKLLSIRRSMEGKTLANLYDPNSMPKNLLEAHSDLDKKIYKFFDKKMNNKEEVLEYLMSLHRNQFSKNLS